MRRWSIGVKIRLGFVLAALLVAGAAAVAHDSVKRQIAASAWVVHTFQVKAALANVLLGLRESEAQSRLFYVTGQPGDVEFFGRAEEHARAALRQVRELTRDNARQQARLGRLEVRLQERLAVIERRVEMRRQEGMEAVLTIVRANGGQALTAEIERLAHESGEEEENLLAARLQEQATLNSRTLALLTWGTLGCSLGLLALGSLISTGVTRPVREYSQTLSTTAIELVAAAQEQQRVMNEQSSSVHQTAASINELAASQKFVGTQSQDAADLAARSAQAAGKGRQEATQALQGLEQIRAKVASTTDQIVSLSDKARLVGRAGRLISDVTEQVNILALNAAVEAARAGEHGRGFAVVAVEVRRLADRTRTSAQEIMEMMSDVQASAQSTVVISEDTTRTVEHGTRQASSIGALFESMAQIVEESARAADRIRLACQEQQSASEQITVALAPLTAGMQQTVVAAQQVATSARQLDEVVRQLRELVG